jgi:hypothetical protein
VSTKKQRECDACGKRIRASHHELRLRDALTGQAIGLYHAPGCQGAAAKYFAPGAVLRGTIAHPKRCGPDLERCEGGLLELSA